MNGKQWKKKNCGQSRSSSQRGEGAKRMCEEMRKDVVKGRGGKNGADRGNRGRSYWRRGLYKNSSEGGVGSERVGKLALAGAAGAVMVVA